MALLTAPFRSLVIGSSGGIGQAFFETLQKSPACEKVVGIHHHSPISIDYENLSSIEEAAHALSEEGPFDLIINTIGILHSSYGMPEKKLGDLNAEQLKAVFQINTIGPALTLKHFGALLNPQQSVFVTLSAKVGSIADNRLGGWYSYRASKAALNMVIKTTSIEWARTKPNTAVIALHPGTVNTRLSKPFRGEEIGRPAQDAVSDMLKVITELNLEDSGKFFSYSGEVLPW